MLRRIMATLLVVGLILTLPIAVLAAYPNYDFVEIWGGPGTDPGEFGDPAQPVEGRFGEVYVSEYAGNRVQVFDQDGMFLRDFGTGQMDGPAGMDIADDGTVYVAENENDRISIWNEDGDHIDHFGSSGVGDGDLAGPSDVAIGPDGLLYVSEYDNDRIQVFELDGTYVRKWGSHGSGNNQLDSPAALDFDSAGLLWVADADNNRIQVFQSNGTYVRTLGTWGSGNGELNWPYDVKLDPHDNVYVADAMNNRVQKFTYDGTFVTKFGMYGVNDGQFDFAWGVLPTQERYVLAADTYNDRVQRFFTPVPTEYEPIAGSNRFTTAVAASKSAYPAGLMKDSEGYKTVVIATGRNWPDALGGATLAGVLDAPILLVDTDALPAAVKAEIVRLGATRAIVLGGTGAVSANVATAIDAIPGVTKVERIGGANRYLTSEAIAWRAVMLQPSDYDYTAFVATGENFPDALASSPIAAANGWPLYLVPASGLRDSTKAAMLDAEIMDAYILGGTAAVSAATESQLKNLHSAITVDRIEGDTRYETAVEIGWFGQAEANMNWTYTALATGLDFPDALTGGPLQGRDRSVMLLTKGQSGIESVVGGAIEDHKNAVWTVRYLGGTAAVSQSTRDAVGKLLY